MTTRYSLPPASDRADMARSARALATLVLVVGLLGLTMWGAYAPDGSAPLAALPDGESVAAPTLPPSA
jgi:hypothetical protein